MGDQPTGDSCMSARRASGSLAEHLPGLLRSAGVTSIELDALHRPASFRGAEVSQAAQLLTGPARDEHRERGFGFWEFVLEASLATDGETRRAMLANALRHNSDHTIRMVVPTDEFASYLEAGAFNDLPARSLVSLTSLVAVAGQPGLLQLPMLDLGVRVGPEGEDAARDAIGALDTPGLLFDSGRSFHFFGAVPLTHRGLIEFLARSQLLSPVIDSRWVSHQLIDGRCGLRISTDTEKSPALHRLIETFE
jgi:hypothetical protein